MSLDEYVKISPGVDKAIRDYLNKRTDKKPYLFISHSNHSDVLYLSRAFFGRMFLRLLSENGVSLIKITPHALRHTAAKINLLRRSSLEQTRTFLRHETITSTLIYAHHIDPMTDDSEAQIEAFILDDDNTIEAKDKE